MPKHPLAVVLHDAIGEAARPDELDTLVQVEQISGLLGELGYRVERLAVGLDLTPLAELSESAPALVFNLVESLGGTGRLIHLAPAVLAAQGVPFTGADDAAMLITSNKLFAKRAMAAAKVITPDWIEDGGAAEAKPGRHYIVKSVWEDASLGIDASSVTGAEGVAGILADRKARFGGAWFAEDYIEGREINVSLLEGPSGPDVLPLAEIVFRDYAPEAPRIVDYRAKWDETAREYHATERVFGAVEPRSALAHSLRQAALACWKCFGLRGYARVDFRIDGEGRPFVLEANANPCLTADAGFMAAVREAGLTPVEAIRRIRDAALRSK